MSRADTMFPLGFGCASLGSRVSRRSGLRALAAAHEAGVRWFDLAPSYGDGLAEGIFSEFARGRREDLVICTKVGIEPARVSLAKRLSKPLARQAIQAFPRLRRTVAAARRVERARLSAGLIRSSLERSLAALGTDHVDILALHDPDLASAMNDEVMSELSRQVEAGKVGRIGVAGSVEDFRELSLAAPTRFTHAQCAVPLLDGAVEAMLAERQPVSVALHSVQSSVAGIVAQFGGAGQAGLSGLLEAHGFSGVPNSALREAALHKLLSLAETHGGVVLVSMFQHAHLSENLNLVSDRDRREAGIALIEALRRSDLLTASSREL